MKLRRYPLPGVHAEQLVIGTRIAGALITLFALVITLSAASASQPATAGASVPGQEQTAQAPTLALPPPDCGPYWKESPFSGIDTDARLSAVAAIAGNDVWAVGFTNSDSLTIHWDGNTWSVVPSPNAGRDDYLYGITAISADDVWAVGSYYAENVGYRTLTLHWDGIAWSIVPSAYAVGQNYLLAVDAVSTNDVWAVGHLSAQTTSTLILHWDGIAWSVVPGPDPLPPYVSLSGIAAISPGNVWAVGSSTYYRDYTLILHWDGIAWSVVPSPNPGGAYNRLSDIEAVSANDMWAVGVYDDRPLTIHWDGSAWSVVPSPRGGPAYNNLYSIAAISTSDVWAVGEYVNGPRYETLVEHWNGTTWSVVSSANVGIYNNFLYGVSAASSSEMWAVGQAGNHRVLVEQFDPNPEIRFTDVCPFSYFYEHVHDLNDLVIISGYNTAPPCDGPDYVPCFKPYNWTTRGQISKVVSLAAGFNDPVTTQTFEDVPPTHTFYQYIERMAMHNVISGYPCGGPNEPCGPGSRPYFRPGSTVSRGQLSKMAALAFGLTEPVLSQKFEDVPPSHPFYQPITRLAVYGIVSGYPCGGPGEPCVPPNNRSYFRPSNPISRGQIAKIVNFARIYVSPDASPTPTLAPTNTIAPTFTATPAPPTATPEATATPGAPKD